MGDTSKFHDVEALVDEIIARRGRSLSVALPIGIGKAVHIANELMRRAMLGELEQLTFFTALSLGVPAPAEDLARRLMEPIQRRLYEDAPDLAYVRLREMGELPDHVHVHEFYYPPGSLLGNPKAQQSYTSVNFTHAIEVLIDLEIDVIAQMVAPVSEGVWDLGGNTDLTLPLLETAKTQGVEVPLVAVQVNDRLPRMSGEAIVREDVVDLVLEHERFHHELLGAPSLPPGDAEYAIGLRAASLLRDGGTIQVGIGRVGEAVCYGACLRDEDAPLYNKILSAIGRSPHEREVVERVGSTDTFEKGLYSSTELLSDGILGLYKRGLLRRMVFEDLLLERARVQLGRAGAALDLAMLDACVEVGALSGALTARDFAWMQRFGMFVPGVTLEEREGERLLVVTTVEGEVITTPADIGLEQTRRLLEEHFLARELSGGAVLHAGFFVGSPSFYEDLRGFDDVDRARVAMKSIRFTNLLYGDEELKRLSRRDARFLNQAMMMTLSGSAVSDGLANGAVVSGVGGQYEFVAMAHELYGARSALMLTATRTSGGVAKSNIIWQYAHSTIPRHLRDIVITEYGIADLRGRSDHEVAARLIEIADSRFQPELIATAKRYGKLASDYQLPSWAGQNTPERLHDALAPFRRSGAIPRCPFGSDLTDVELDLIEALSCLQDVSKRLSKGEPPDVDLHGLATMASIPTEAMPYLERMGVSHPRTLREIAMQRALLYGLGAKGIV